MPAPTPYTNRAPRPPPTRRAHGPPMHRARALLRAVALLVRAAPLRVVLHRGV